jgi:hypothetical protein
LIYYNRFGKILFINIDFFLFLWLIYCFLLWTNKIFMVWYIINFPSFFTNKRVDSIINIPFFINSVRVKSFWIIRISRLSSPLWIEDIIISYGFVNLSRRQYIFILLIICLFKESSHLNWKHKYLFSKKSSSAFVLLLYWIFYLHSFLSDLT